MNELHRVRLKNQFVFMRAKDAEKTELVAAARDFICGLEDAMREGDATDEELAQLNRLREALKPFDKMEV